MTGKIFLLKHRSNLSNGDGRWRWRWIDDPKLKYTVAVKAALHCTFSYKYKIGRSKV